LYAKDCTWGGALGGKSYILRPEAMAVALHEEKGARMPKTPPMLWRK
jgi:hypothetical protein